MNTGGVADYSSSSALARSRSAISFSVAGRTAGFSCHCVFPQSGQRSGKIDAVTEKKLPQYKQLMEQNPVAVAQTSVNGATITAYQNGYAVYEADGAHSVMAVNRCGDYRYDFNDGTYQVVPAEVFEEAE